jgi:hypothetical protein
MDDDPFDLKRLRIDPAELAPMRKKPEPKRSQAEFVKFPYERVLSTAGRIGDAPLAVLVELAHQSFKTHRKQVPLTNVALRSVGINRCAKLRALRQLEEAGLVQVEWRGRRSPLVTLLWQ